MTNDDGLDRDPGLAAWIARAEEPAAADVERLARRVSAAVRAQWPGRVPRTWRTEAAGWSRLLVPLAAAAGLAAALMVGRIGVPARSVAAATQDLSLIHI